MPEHHATNFGAALDYMARWSETGTPVDLTISLHSDPAHPIAEIRGQVNPLQMAVEGELGAAWLEVGEDHTGIYLRSGDFISLKTHGQVVGDRPLAIEIEFVGYRVRINDAMM